MDGKMERTMTIAGVLLLTLVISCRETDTNEAPISDATVKTKVIPETSPAEDKPIDPLDECQALLDQARKAGSTDIQAAIKALDQADQCLHDCMYTANQVYWLQMNSELKQARTELIKAQQEKDR